MELSFKGTPKELGETMHYLYARITYWNGNECVIRKNKPMTDQQIDDEVLRDGWFERGVRRIEFCIDSGANPPFAVFGR